MKFNRRAKLARDVLRAMYSLRRQGYKECTSFQIAQEVARERGDKFLVGYGTLFWVLKVLEGREVLDSRWEETGLGEAPRRKYYRIWD